MHTITRILLPRCDHFFAIVVYLRVEGVRLFEFEIWKQKLDFWQRTFYSFEKIFNLNHQACFEIKKPDVYLNKNQDFCIGHKHLNISFFKKERNKEQNCNSFSIFVLFYVLSNIANIYTPNFVNLLILLQSRLSFSF